MAAGEHVFCLGRVRDFGIRHAGDGPLTDLTPAQHARIRRHIALLPAYIWAFYIWSIFFQQFHLTGAADTEHVFRDFVHFYIQGVVANDRNAAALYDTQAQMALVPQYVPVVVAVPFPVVYGPQVSLLFAPFARLPYLWSLTLWLALTGVVFGLSVYALWRSSPRLSELGWPVAVLAIGCPAVHITMMYGQTTVLAMACFIAAYLALRARRPLLAGLAIGMLAYKPQLGLAAAVVFVGAAEWRVVAGAVAGAAAQLLVALFYWGPRVFGDYGRALMNLPNVIPMLEPEKQHLHSLRSSFEMMALAPSLVTLATVIASLVVLGAALWGWRRVASLRVKFAVLLLATGLVNPHMFGYDLVVIVPALLLLWDRLLDGDGVRTWLGWTLAGLMVLIYLEPLFEVFTPVLRLQPSVALNVGLLTLLLAVSPRRICSNA